MPRRSARARGLLLALSLGLAASACKREQEPAPPTTQAPAQAPDRPPADKDVMTYVSGTKQDAPKGAPADAEDDEAAGAPDDAARDEVQLVERDATLSSAEEALALVERAATEALGHDVELKISPALTSTWPPEDLALVYLVYPMVPIEGSLKVKVGTPIRIRVNLEDGAVETKKKLSASRVLKTLDMKRESSVVRQNLATSEQALINVLLRKRSVARSYRLLDGYREWFNANLEFMTDFSHRYPKAMRWFKDPTPSDAMP
ncbi:MAG: hypothetical protein H6713_28770 [Myxococcales bacterium]|nr:hypothetical protein [Myxococcales bacterium]MCB9753956.1 hypothetical protein [Myxococcales bacterium]